MLILIKRKSSVFTNSFVTGLFLHFEPVIAIKTNKPSVDVVVRATKAGSFVLMNILKWTSIYKRLLYNKATLTYKALNGLTP